jgi:hypothetical protein
MQSAMFVWQAIWPHSGHYRPTEENFQEFQSFLKDNMVDLTEVKVCTSCSFGNTRQILNVSTEPRS